MNAPPNIKTNCPSCNAKWDLRMLPECPCGLTVQNCDNILMANGLKLALSLEKSWEGHPFYVCWNYYEVEKPQSYVCLRFNYPPYFESFEGDFSHDITPEYIRFLLTFS